MGLFDLIYRVRTLRIPFLWLAAVLAATLAAWVCAGCRLEYRSAKDGTYAGLQIAPPAGPLDPNTPEQES